MTAAAVPARRERPAARAVPWTRLAWVSWRQHRAALAGAVALLGAIAVYLAITGRHIYQAYNAYAACLAAFPQAAAGSGQGGLYAGCAPSCPSTAPRAVRWGPPGSTRSRSRSCCWRSRYCSARSPAPRCWCRELESGTFRFAWTLGAC